MPRGDFKIGDKVIITNGFYKGYEGKVVGNIPRFFSYDDYTIRVSKLKREVSVNRHDIKYFKTKKQQKIDECWRNKMLVKAFEAGVFDEDWGMRV